MNEGGRFALVPSGLALLWLLMMLTGTGALDRTVLDALYSADHPALRSAAIFATMFGEWPFVVVVTLVAGLALLLFGHKRQSMLFLAVVLIGRVLVELQKIGIGRLRPEERAHLVPVKSLSFPSGHSANSMILLLAFALLVVSRGYRRIAVPIAVLCSMLIGITRPMLGVHWPSDVIGGWSFGAAWVLIMAGLAERWPFGSASTLTRHSRESGNLAKTKKPGSPLSRG